LPYGVAHQAQSSLATADGLNKEVKLWARSWTHYHFRSGPCKCDGATLSNDSRVEETLVGVVGRYQYLPSPAVVANPNPEAQGRVPAPAQPSLPMRRSRSNSSAFDSTHDDARNEKTHLFAASDIATRKRIAKCRRAQSMAAVLVFFNAAKTTARSIRDVQMVVANSAHAIPRIVI